MPLLVHASHIFYRGPDRLDITRKSAPPAGIIFAPSDALLWPLIAKRKRGLSYEDHAKYRERYLDEMRRSYVVHRREWDAFLERSEITICCYCQYPHNCHRTILGRDVLAKLGATFVGERDAEDKED